MKEYEIVINECYSGYKLSSKAIIEILKLKGISENRISISNKKWDNIVLIDKQSCYRIMDILKLPRHDKDLVNVIKKLGEESNTYCSKLNIVKIQSKIYKIIENDGYKTVEELDEEIIFCINN